MSTPCSTLVLGSILAACLAACGTAGRIEPAADKTHRLAALTLHYEDFINQDVLVNGKVSQQAPADWPPWKLSKLLGQRGVEGAYLLDDGTAAVWVISRSPVPRVGARLRLQGTVIKIVSNLPAFPGVAVVEVDRLKINLPSEITSRFAILGERHDVLKDTADAAIKEEVAFLAGALLGDNVTWVIAQKPVSVEKRRLFEKCASMLGLPQDSDLLRAVSAGRGVSVATSIDGAIGAILRFESSVRAAHTQEVAQLVRLGGTIMMTMGTASSLELALSSTEPNREYVARVFRLSVLGLKGMSSTMQLPGETASLLSSLPDYQGHDSEVTRTRSALIKISEQYKIGPLTAIRRYGDAVSLADTDLTRVWTLFAE